MSSVKLTGELIHGFTTAFLMSKFDDPVPTPNFHLELWDLLCDDAKRVAVAAPRGHAKSTACTHSFTLANLCFKTAHHVMIVSDTETQACDFLRDIRNEFAENQALIDAFEFSKLEKDNEKEIIGIFKDGTRFRVVAKGSEQKMRGIKWRNKRPDLIIGDDLENDEIVMNDERRAKFKKWFLNALIPCAAAKRGRIRIVGTILHLDSLLEDLMPVLNHPCTILTELQDSWDADAYKLYCKQKDVPYVKRAWKSYRYKAHNPDFSEVLWPEQYDQTALQTIRAGYIEQGFPEGYAQEYLNYPIDETNAYFRKSDFVEWDKDGRDKVPLTYYIGGDLAISEKDTRAFSVFVVVGVDARGRWKVVDVVRFRGDSLEIVNEMFRLNNVYKPDIFFLEQENIARTLGPVINKTMQERSSYFHIEPMTASQDKIKRARSLQAIMRQGMIEFDIHAEWFPVLQNEMLQFPRGKYKDQVDAFAWIAIGLESVVEALTLAEQEEEDYREEYEDTYYNFTDMGTCSTTGY